MTETQMLLAALGLVGTIIGILYKIHTNSIAKNSKDIKELDDKTDKRLDDVEKDIVGLKATQRHG